jgi:hypothetical protein
MKSPWCRALVLVALLAASPVRAQDLSTTASANPGFSGITSSAPRSGGLLPLSLFDPSRLTFSNSLVFGMSTGSGFGNGTAGLFTSSLGYKLNPKMALRLNVGAHVNPAFGSNEIARGIFLEGAAFDWHPSANSLLRVEYRDVRSPLQNSWGYGYGPSYGYAPLGSGLAGDPLRN